MKNNELSILWTNADPVTSELMVMMYALNAIKRDWWEKFTVIIWGSTAKLIAENDRIQNFLKEAQGAGVEFSACQSCAEQLGVMQTLVNLGIEVKYWGMPLTDILKNGQKLLSI